MYAKTEQAFKYFSSDLCSGSMVKRIERQNPERLCFMEKHVISVLINLRTVIFEDTEKGCFQSLKQHKTGPIFSLSLYQCFILYRLTHSINLLHQQNASAGL